MLPAGCSAWSALRCAQESRGSRPTLERVEGCSGHQDIAAAEREITIVPRANDNGARSKSRQLRRIPVSAELLRLYADYLHAEYDDLDSDYVFVGLFAEPRGHALSYPAVYDLVLRLRSRTGIDFDPHWCRHSLATPMQVSDVVPGASFDMVREQLCAGR